MTRTSYKGAHPDNFSGLRVVGTMILLEPLPIEETTKGGLVLARTSKETERVRNVLCKVVEIGSGAWHDQVEDFCRVGDWVLIGLYIGKLQKSYKDGKEYRLVRDVDILCVVELGEEIEGELANGVIRDSLRDYTY